MKPHQCKKQDGLKTVTFLFSTPVFTEIKVSIWRQNAHSQPFLPSSRWVTVPVPPLTSCHAVPTSRPVRSRFHARREPSPTHLTAQKSPGATPPTPHSSPSPWAPSCSPLGAHKRLCSASPQPPPGVGEAPGPSAPQAGAACPSLTLLRLGARQRDEEEDEEGAEAEQRGRLPGPRGERPPRAHHAPRCSEGMAGRAGRAGPGRGRVSAPAPRGRRRPSERRRRRPPPAAGPSASGLPASCRTAPAAGPEALAVPPPGPAATSPRVAPD